MMPPLDSVGTTLTRRAWLGWVAAAAGSAPGARLLAADPAPGPWDSDELDFRASLDPPVTPWAVAFSPDGSLLASAGFDGPKGGLGPSRVDLWETATWAKRPGFEILDIRIDRLSFSPDGKSLLAAGLDRASLIVCDPDGGRRRTLVENVETAGIPSPAVAAPDGKSVATAGPEGLVIWDAETWKPFQELLGFRDRGFTLAYRETPNWLTGGWLYAMGYGGIIQVVTPRGHPPGLNMPPGFVYAGPPWWGLIRVRGVARPWESKHLAISRDGEFAAIVAQEEDSTARIDLYEIEGDDSWRKRRGLGLAGSQADGLYCLAFTPDGRALVAGCSDRLIRRWGLAKGGNELPPLKGFNGAINALAFSKDGTMMAAADTQGRSVKVWSPRQVGKD